MSGQLLRWLAACVALGAVWGCGDGDLPHRGTGAYREAVSAFYAGVTALQVGAPEQARESLEEAARLAPGEPAVWANLGVLALRQGDFKVAAERLERARELAPESGRVVFLQGRLEEMRGNETLALARFRRAAHLAPEEPKARFALAGALERAGEVEAAATEVDSLAEQFPENLALRLEQARLAARLGDGERLQAAVDRIWRAGLPEAAQAQFGALAEAGEDFRTAATQVVFLKNVLMREPGFRTDLAQVQDRLSEGAAPVSAFLRLETPETGVAPVDRALRFEQEALEGPDGVSEVAAVWLNGEDGPSVFTVRGRTVGRMQRALPDGATMVFPGGNEEASPGPAGICALDWNNDFRTDLALAGAGGLRLYVQEAGGEFRVEATQGSPCTGVWTADVEMDGDLDLVVGVAGGAPVLLRNNRDGTALAGPAFEPVRDLRGFVWMDLDGDGVPDAALLDGEGRLRRFVNERNGMFRLQAETVEDVAAVALGDGDGDGVPDLLALKRDGTVVREAGEDVLVRVEEVDPGDGAVRLMAADLDNNGAEDLVVSAGSRSWAFVRDANGAFREVDLPEGVNVQAVADVTGDGRVDLLGVAGGAPVRLVNRGAAAYHWQVVRPRAVDRPGDGRINSFAIGGEVEVRAGFLAQRKIVEGPAVHVGLGENERVAAVRVLWPNGTAQAEFGLAADRTVTAVQRLKGSCPWVFAFDGREMRFVTDFLWRSPLGMRINAQETAGVMQTEDRVRIRGEMLKAVDGFYEVRITADLWETHFVDHVSLLAVDHPAGTEMFIDERFARTPPDLSARFTGELRPFKRVVDDRGAEVTDRVRTLDGRYADTFALGTYQGLAREHGVEVEVGEEVPAGRPVWLVAQGWIYPTDSSMNVAVSQGSEGPPRGLRLEAADSLGAWRVVAEDLGFPAGKKKTVLIDLTEALRVGRRFRLRTNLEVYWDRLAWAETAGVRTREERVRAARAELRYRGFSRVEAGGRRLPEVPVYEAPVTRGQLWADLEGYYTRFGDVRPLLEDVDDRYAIVNAGDELALSFPAVDPPPPGFQRDFVLIGDGWVKDGDFNTAFSRTVRPLPSHGRPEYDAPPGRLEEDPVYLRHPSDWREYHTRYVTPREFHQAMGVER